MKAGKSLSIALLPELLGHLLCQGCVKLCLIMHLVGTEEGVVQLLAGHCVHIVLHLLHSQVPYGLHTCELLFLHAEHGGAVGLVGEGPDHIHIQLVAGLLAQEESLGLLVQHVHGDIGGIHLLLALHHVGFTSSQFSRRAYCL